MALGVAGAQTVVPVSGSPLLLTMPNTSQGGSVKPAAVPPTAAVPTAQLPPTLTVTTSAPLILPKLTMTSLTTTTPTPTSAVVSPPSQDINVNKQLLMEQLANSVTKSGTNGQQDSDINEELVEFMK